MIRTQNLRVDMVKHFKPRPVEKLSSTSGINGLQPDSVDLRVEAIKGRRSRGRLANHSLRTRQGALPTRSMAPSRTSSTIGARHGIRGEAQCTSGFKNFVSDLGGPGRFPHLGDREVADATEVVASAGIPEAQTALSLLARWSPMNPYVWPHSRWR